jgi:hypothetical protein
MAIFFFPSIKRDDYNAFRRIVGSDLPYTFDEWANEQTKLVAERVSGCSLTRSVEVNPNEFVEYLRLPGRRASRHELNNFAFHQSGLKGNDEQLSG